MKKLLTLIFVLFAFIAISQTSNGYVSFVADTTTNAETEYLVLASASPLTKNYAVTLTVTPVNSSGTATVTGMPQGSFDGTTFYDLESSAATINTAGTVAVKTYTYANAYYHYYRWECVSTGTGVTVLNGILGLKRK